ncbi:putative uncharacterized protein DDB_G0279653 [Cotesia glomerata]|uniref:putative uncharacterized protein DDB_G0279653 n=1 Tax=Cotesia glomerata TaxID=32391 RepID=UPI001D014B73|nr:putative uncharacterized protein DDB_G0279653 [Cotesia glomerata]
MSGTKKTRNSNTENLVPPFDLGKVNPSQLPPDELQALREYLESGTVTDPRALDVSKALHKAEKALKRARELKDERNPELPDRTMVNDQREQVELLQRQRDELAQQQEAHQQLFQQQMDQLQRQTEDLRIQREDIARQTALLLQQQQAAANPVGGPLPNQVRNNGNDGGGQAQNVNPPVNVVIPQSIKYALEAVPYFNGHNIPLSHFIEGCKEAFSYDRAREREQPRLKPEIEQRIDDRGTFAEVLLDAVKIEKEIRAKDLLRGKTSSRRDIKPFSAPTLEYDLPKRSQLGHPNNNTKSNNFNRVHFADNKSPNNYRNFDVTSRDQTNNSGRNYNGNNYNNNSNQGPYVYRQLSNSNPYNNRYNNNSNNNREPYTGNVNNPGSFNNRFNNNNQNAYRYNNNNNNNNNQTPYRYNNNNNNNSQIPYRYNNNNNNNNYQKPFGNQSYNGYNPRNNNSNQFGTTNNNNTNDRNNFVKPNYEQARSTNSQPPREPVCYYCKMPGHFMVDCAKRREINNRGRDLDSQPGPSNYMRDNNNGSGNGQPLLRQGAARETGGQERPVLQVISEEIDRETLSDEYEWQL